MLNERNVEPCPACKSNDAHMRHERDADGFGDFSWIECPNCGFRSRSMFSSESCPQFYQEVRDAWNIRKLVTDHNKNK
jgi:Zn ribbon nucleic-acid-binding protein